jgi:hypothetical protein
MLFAVFSRPLPALLSRIALRIASGYFLILDRAEVSGALVRPMSFGKGTSENRDAQWEAFRFSTLFSPNNAGRAGGVMSSGKPRAFFKTVERYADVVAQWGSRREGLHAT